LVIGCASSRRGLVGGGDGGNTAMVKQAGGQGQGEVVRIVDIVS